jgi:hypothetical protein
VTLVADVTAGDDRHRDVSRVLIQIPQMSVVAAEILLIVFHAPSHCRLTQAVGIRQAAISIQSTEIYGKSYQIRIA